MSTAEPVTGRPDPAVAAIRSAVRAALADQVPGAHVIVASSGGADSLALAAATAFESGRSGWVVAGVVVDHGLQADSDEIAAAAAGQLSGLGLEPVTVERVDVGRAGGPEAAARAARYEALRAVAERSDAVVLLGHTLDDQAETVLLGLARGSGPRSLAGMAPVAGRFRRPLLAITRRQTEQACTSLGLRPWADPHNEDQRFARVRVRRRVLPLLEAELGPGVTEALARTAALARADADALDALAAALLEDAADPDGLLVDRLATAPRALVGRVVRQAAIREGAPPGELFAVHVDAVTRLLTDWHGQHGVDLPGHVVARRTGDRLTFERTGPA